MSPKWKRIDTLTPPLPSRERSPLLHRGVVRCCFPMPFKSEGPGVFSFSRSFVGTHTEVEKTSFPYAFPRRTVGAINRVRSSFARGSSVSNLFQFRQLRRWPLALRARITCIRATQAGILDVCRHSGRAHPGREPASGACASWVWAGVQGVSEEARSGPRVSRGTPLPWMGEAG